MDWIDEGRAVREWREQQGWTQADLAERLGTDRTTINHIEAGRRRPGQDLAYLIQEAGGPAAPVWVRRSLPREAVPA